MVDELLAEEFERHRTHLRAVAYRLLGSISEADDAVQEAWLRLSRTDVSAVSNLRGWLTTVTGRICLDMLRTRASRRESPLHNPLPDPIVGTDPEQEALTADSVGLALMVVLDTLAPAERLAFVLHDMFAVPFESIGAIAGRSPAATKQLASRARGRIKAAPTPDPDLARQQRAVDAFFAAARRGDFEALLAVLDPDVVLRAERAGGVASLVRGAAAVASQAVMFASPAAVVRPVLINGAAGVVVSVSGRPTSMMAFTVSGGRIVEIDAVTDPGRLTELLSA